MTEQEYMDQIIKDWNNNSKEDDMDYFDYVNLMEEYEELYEWEECLNS